MIRNINKEENKNPEIKKRRRKLNDEQIQAQIDKSLKIVNEYSRINDEIRKKRMGKTPQEYVEEVQKEDFKRNLYSKIILAVFILFIAVMVFLFVNYSAVIGISINKNINLEECNEINRISNVDDMYLSYKDEILVYSNQKISTYDKNGKLVWEYTFNEKFTPNIYVKDYYIVVSNNSMGMLYFFNNKKEVYNKKIDGEIENVFIDEAGNVAVEYSTNGYKKIIGVYDKVGKHLYNVYLSSYTIVGISLIDGANKMVIITTNTSSFNVGIEISLIDVYKENVTPNKIASLDNKFLYDYYIKNNELILLLNDSIVKVNLKTGNTEKLKTFDSNQILYIAINNDNYYTCVEKKIGTEIKYSNENYSNSNKLIGTSDIDSSPKMFKNMSLVNFLVYQNLIELYNKWGINIKNISISYPPKDIIPFRNGKSVALIYTNKIYIANI